MRFPWNHDRELQRELAHHLHHATAEYQRQGYSHRDALSLAKRDFGGIEQIKEACRDQSTWAGLSGFAQDLNFGLRMLRRTPVITLAAILSLALGIGANTAIVSLMDVVLWRALPVPHPRQLVLVHWQGHGFPQDLADAASGRMWDEGGVSVADFFSYSAFDAMRKGIGPRASVAAFAFPETVSISFRGQASVAKQRAVTGNFFSTLQVQPALGRLFTDNDDRDASPATAVLSHRFWERSFGSDPTIIGQTMIIDNRPQIIVGILERSFYGLVPGDGSEIYTPTHHAAAVAMTPDSLINNRFWMFSLLARRAPGISEHQLQSALDVLFRSSWPKMPRNLTTAPHIRLAEGGGGLGLLREEFRNPLAVLAGLVGLLLVIACTNIVNLLLARAVARQREVSVRISLGCSRWRLIRQFITESALLAFCGGVLSIAIGLATANLLGRFLAGVDRAPVEVSLDMHVLLTAAAITLFALLLFGLFPAFHGAKGVSSSAPHRNLAGFGREPEHRWSPGRILIVAQVTMSVLLLMAAVAFTRNLLSVESADPGFDRRNLLLFGLRPGTSGYDKPRLAPFYSDVEQRLAATPGVMAVGLASVRAMNVGGWWDSVRLSGQSTIRNASVNAISAGYLPLFFPHMVAGRSFTEADIHSNAKVAVIGQDLANQFGGPTALGKTIEFPDGPPGRKPRQFQIIGIAPAIAATSMKERSYTIWLPVDRNSPELTVVLRCNGRPQSVLPFVRQTIASIDRNLPLVDVATMEEQISQGLQRERMFATLCTAFGGLALLLSALGLYGVISYSISRRRGEIGVRLALGAMRRQVLSMVLGEGLWLIVSGVLLAVPLVCLGAQGIDKLLLNRKSLEPVSIAWALGTLLIVALLATTLPAVRASRVDPAEVLRED